MDTKSECTTNGIEITVEPKFIPGEIASGGEKYLFSYNVTIDNNSDKWVKLLSRHWIIIDADGKKDEVVGEGVIGYQPDLHPGDVFNYTSYCPLRTPWGTMEGSFKMIDENNKKFNAKIKRFYLVSPEATDED